MHRVRCFGETEVDHGETEVGMSKQTLEEQKKRELDLELDRELESTFPASDALKITRRPPESRPHREQPSEDIPRPDGADD